VRQKGPKSYLSENPGGKEDASDGLQQISGRKGPEASLETSDRAEINLHRCLGDGAEGSKVRTAERNTWPLEEVGKQENRV